MFGYAELKFQASFKSLIGYAELKVHFSLFTYLRPTIVPADWAEEEFAGTIELLVVGMGDDIPLAIKFIHTAVANAAVAVGFASDDATTCFCHRFAIAIEVRTCDFLTTTKQRSCSCC